MGKNIITYIIWVIIGAYTFAQAPKSVSKSTQKVVPQTKIVNTKKPIACDCEKAIPVAVTLNGQKYGPTVSANGFGELQEIKIKEQKSKHYFEQEHNTAWYLVSVNHTGDFVFEIMPEDSTEDHDFLFFEYTDSSFCKNFSERKVTPLRTCISRVEPDIGGRTGLSPKAKSEFAVSGPGSSFSKAVSVTSGKRYMLVIDNIKDGGKGHTVEFSFLKHIELKGVVTNEAKQPLKAEISLEDSNGNVIETTTSDEKTGNYHISTDVKTMKEYSLNFYNDSMFVAAKTIKVTNTPTIGQEDYQNIKTVLLTLKGGRRFAMDNLNFYGNSPVLLPGSMPSLKSLYKLMKKNKKLKISIEGHTNGCAEGIDCQKLSEDRAKTVYDYMFERNIQPERMQTKGWGDKKMLFPLFSSESKQAMNRRVEVLVISME